MVYFCLGLMKTFFQADITTAEDVETTSGNVDENTQAQTCQPQHKHNGLVEASAEVGIYLHDVTGTALVKKCTNYSVGEGLTGDQEHTCIRNFYL